MSLREFRYALRTLWHSKAFATVAILCLGFGIGINTTIFSIVDGVLLKPYPYQEPHRLVVLNSQNARLGEPGLTGVSYLDLKDWKAATRTFTAMGAVTGRSMTIADGGGEPERYLGAAVSWDFFPMLGVSPIVGHGFRAEDDRTGAAGVVLLSHDLWTRRYNSDANIVGRSITIDGRPHLVVGVMPPKFAFPQNQRLWIPLAPVAHGDTRRARSLLVFGRIAPGVTAEQARLWQQARASPAIDDAEAAAAGTPGRQVP